MPEQHNIEYKQSWHDDYLKWVCGFDNAQGGTIHIGKDDNGQIVKCSGLQKSDGNHTPKDKRSIGHHGRG